MIVAIIPAKGHSRRLPGKNVRDFAGKPMIVHSIDTAKASGLFDRIVVSTDEEYVAVIARKEGATVVMRTPELCERDGHPDCGTQEVTRHAIVWLQTAMAERIKVDSACCIYPCAPLMTAQDLHDGYALVKKSVSSPMVWFAYATGPDGVDAGQWYWGAANAFLWRVPLTESFKLRLPAERTCDINTSADFDRALVLYNNMHAG